MTFLGQATQDMNTKVFAELNSFGVYLFTRKIQSAASSFCPLVDLLK